MKGLAAPSGPSPWALDAILFVGVTSAAGVGLVVVAWARASLRATPGEQVPLIGLGIVGLCLAFTGHLLWLIQGRRAVGRRVVQLLGDPPVRPGRAVMLRPSAEALVVGPGLRLFHRADCPLAGGPQWAAVSRGDLPETSRSPCGVCRP